MFDNLTVARSVSKLTPKQLGDLDEIDEDVAREAERVKSNWRSSDVVTVSVIPSPKLYLSLLALHVYQDLVLQWAMRN